MNIARPAGMLDNDHGATNNTRHGLKLKLMMWQTLHHMLHTIGNGEQRCRIAVYVRVSQEADGNARSVIGRWRSKSDAESAACRCEAEYQILCRAIHGERANAA